MNFFEYSRKKREAATKGPWEAHRSVDRRRGSIIVPNQKLIHSYEPEQIDGIKGKEERFANCEYIVFAVNNLPKIEALLERALSNCKFCEFRAEINGKLPCASCAEIRAELSKLVGEGE